MRRVDCKPLCPSTNQIIQNYLDDHNYAEHRRRVKTAAPVVDTNPPNSYAHLQVKMKKLQDLEPRYRLPKFSLQPHPKEYNDINLFHKLLCRMEAERNAKILQDNMLLLRRMSEIVNSKGRYNYDTPSQTSSPGRRRPSSLVRPQREFQGAVHPMDAYIEQLQADWKRKDRLLRSLQQETRAKASSAAGRLCPRYVRCFGARDEDDGLPSITVTQRPQTTPRFVPTYEKRYHTTCEACKELQKDRPLTYPRNRKLSLVRPKAAPPRRRTQPSTVKFKLETEDEDTGDEDKIEEDPILLAPTFKKDFAHVLPKEDIDEFMNNLDKCIEPS